MRRAQAKRAPNTVKPSPRQAAPKAFGMNSKNPMPQARAAQDAAANKAANAAKAKAGAGMTRGNVNLGRQQARTAKKTAEASLGRKITSSSGKAGAMAMNAAYAAAEAKSKAAAGLTPGQMRKAANVGPAADAATAARRANATQTPTPMPGMAKGGLAKKKAATVAAKKGKKK
jgi:hypothetical protein